MNRPARLVYCYDSADSGYRHELEKHLTALHREQLIAGWHQELIAAGDDLQETIRQQVSDADVLLLLVSADFLASERCQTVVSEALRRHDDRRTVVCPVIVRPCDWRGAPLGGLSALPPDGHPVTTRPNQDEAWLDVARGLRCLIEPPVGQPPGPTPNPYRGLSAFQAEDQAVFFGRQELTRQLWQALQRLHDPQGGRKRAPPRIFAVLGPSGSGKSSLVRAGLVPALHQQPAWGAAPPQVVTFTPGEHPVERLAQALLPLLPQDHRGLDAARLDELEAVLRKPGADGVAHGLRRFALTLPGIERMPLLVVVDQFEEVYAQCKDAAEQDLFVALLLHAAADANPAVSIILTLRNDFVGETRRHRELNQAISRQEAHVLVPVMGPEELRRAIALPAQQSGHPIDEATTELLLREARDNETALPLLEFALTRIWEGMQAGKKPEAALRELGGVGGALAGKAQAMYHALGPAEQATAQRALVRLVQLGEGTRDTRRRAPIRELCGRGQTEHEVLAVLRRFATEDARLITLSGDGVDTIAEVTHEALFEHWIELRTWINDSRADRRFHDRAAEAARLWDEDGRRPGRLWRRPDLDLLRDYRRRKSEELSPLQTAFLHAAEQQRRRDAILSMGSAVTVLVAMLVAAGIYITKERQRRHDADQAAERIRQQLLDTYVEQGRQLLLEKENPFEAILWLHRAQARRSANPILPDLLRGARYRVEATQTVLVGHTSSVLSATFSPDGTRIVTASLDNTARLWEAQTGRLLAELKGHGSSVLSAMFSPDGTRIVTASEDKTARVWEVQTGRLLAELKGHGSSVLSAAFSPDGKYIVTASGDHTARVWQAQTGRLVVELKGHGSRVSSATFSPDGRRIVTASEDNTARVWDAQTARLVEELKGHRSGVASASFSPDGRRIVTASEDNTARVWDAQTGRQLAELKGHGSSVLAASFSPDSKRIVTAGLDSTARVFDAQTGHQLAELKGHGSSVLGASFNPSGTRIVTASEDNSSRVWEAQTGRVIAELKGHGSSVLGASFSPDGVRVVTASYDSTARVWEVDKGRLVTELKGHGCSVLGASFSPDGTRIVTASSDNTARVWEALTGRLAAELRGHGSSVLSASFSPDGTRIVTASDDNTARVWEAQTGRLLAELKGHESRVLSASFSPDSRYIVTASWDDSAGVWEAQTGRLLAELKGHQDSVWSAAYSPDGTRIVTSSGDNTARVWEAQTGRLVAELKGHGSSVWRATFGPDGKRIVTASDDKTSRVWDAQTGHLVVELKGHGSGVWSATFSPEGTRIVTASGDNTARVWEAQTGRQVAELKGHAARVLSATFSPNGTRIVTASLDNTARIWEATTGHLVAELKGHGDSVLSAMFSPDGTRIVTTSEDKTAHVWDISPETQTADQIAKLLRCKVGARFDREDNNLIIPALPNPTECLSLSSPR